MNLRRCGAVCLAVVTAAGLAARAAAETGWSELRGHGFVLRGALPHDTLGELGCELQTVVQALRPLHAGAASGGAALEVLAVDNGRDARELLPALSERRGAGPLGAYWSGPHGHHIVVRVDAAPDERRRRILHEYVHSLTHRSHTNPARWLDEGLAEFWEGAAIRPDRLEVGQPVAAHMKTLRSKNWIPLSALVSASSLPANDRTLALFYAQSWALVRYLVMKGGSRDLFLAQALAPWALPTDEELRRSVGEAREGMTVMGLGAGQPGCGALPIRALSRLESLVAKARALADGERPAAAGPLLLDALRLEAGHPPALETLGIVQFAQNRPEEAAETLDRVISGGHATHLAYYYRAILAGPVPELSDGSGRVPMVDYLRRAVDLDPGFAPARERLQEVIRKSRLAPPTRL